MKKVTDVTGTILVCQWLPFHLELTRATVIDMRRLTLCCTLLIADYEKYKLK